jgi:outer membrane protein TolC
MSRFLVCWGLVLSVWAPFGWGQRQPLRVGVVIDGPWERNLGILEAFDREITQLLQNEYDVALPSEKRTEADWTLPGVEAAFDRLIQDPEVDFILTLGVLGSHIASRRGPLPKPVIAPYVLLPETQDIPYVLREVKYPGQERVDRFHVSGVPNLSYVDIRSDLDVGADLEAFLEVVHFEKLAILTMKALVDALPQLADNIRRDVAPFGFEPVMIPVGDSIEGIFSALPADAEAVYVAPLLQLSAANFDRLIQGLNERRLPTFSLWGRSEVERGVLASFALDLDTDRLARRVALNIHRILLGESAADLPVDFDRDRRITINMATARAIGVSPSFVLLTEADLLNEARERAPRQLSLAEVVRQASQANLDLAAADRTVTAGLEIVRQARANLRPRADVSGQALFIDQDRAAASFGSQGQRQGSGSLTLNQLIYSEQARAGYDIEKKFQDLRTEERAQLRLDVVLEGAESYLNVLRAKTVERIQRDNLRLTRTNLNLAEARVELGAARRDEVFRWQSQIATNRKDVIDANARRNQAEMSVNRVLNRPIEENFLTVETGLDDPELVTSFEQIRPYIENPRNFREFRQFMVREAFDGSPELRQLDNAILAQERALLASKRAFYVPTVGLQADLTGFKNGGSGSSAPVFPPEAGFSFMQPNNLNWTVGVNASLPLFQGGALRSRRTQAEIELDELTVQREATRQRVEQRIRSILHAAGASFAGIQLSRDAAEAAHRNLELVRDSYSEGVIDIIRLIDAQNQTLVAELVAANSVFDHLTDLMMAQRAVGRFDYFRSIDDRQKFLGRLSTFFADAGVEVRKP